MEKRRSMRKEKEKQKEERRAEKQRRKEERRERKARKLLTKLELLAFENAAEEDVDEGLAMSLLGSDAEGVASEEKEKHRKKTKKKKKSSPRNKKVKKSRMLEDGSAEDVLPTEGLPALLALEDAPAAASRGPNGVVLGSGRTVALLEAFEKELPESRLERFEYLKGMALCLAAFPRRDLEHFLSSVEAAALERPDRPAEPAEAAPSPMARPEPAAKPKAGHAKSLGPRTWYIVDPDNLFESKGLRYSKSKDEQEFSGIADWGTVVRGEEQDGWLQCGLLYLPMRLNGAPVLKRVEHNTGNSALLEAPLHVRHAGVDAEEDPDAYLVDKSKLVQTAGIKYALKPGSCDTDGGFAAWGTTVLGADVEEDEGWVRVTSRFLPKRINGWQVLIRKDHKAKQQLEAKQQTMAEMRRKSRLWLAVPLKERREAAENQIYLIGQALERKRKVVNGGIISRKNLTWFAKEMLACALGPQDWERGWINLQNPEKLKGEVGRLLVSILLDLVIQADAHEELEPAQIKRVAWALAGLSKGGRVKLGLVVQVLQEYCEALAKSSQAWQVVSWLLLHWFPRPKNDGWGWSRVGWSFQEWWKLMERCLQEMDKQRAFDLLRFLLERMEEQENGAAMHTQLTESQLEQLQHKLQHLVGCQDESTLRMRLGAVSIWPSSGVGEAGSDPPGSSELESS